MKTFLSTLICTIVILIGLIFTGVAAAKLSGVKSYAMRSAKGLKKLEHAVSNVRIFQQENGRFPTHIEINCTDYKIIEPNDDICIQKTFLNVLEGGHDFIMTYKSTGVPFSGKAGAGPKREFTYDTRTKAFNYSHLDSYAEVLLWRMSHVFIGLIIIFLPLMFLLSSGRKRQKMST